MTDTATSSDSALKNVWDAPRNTPSVVGKKDYAENHPFGSSYYFAHNSSKATGGYKDGLKMEDYTMNGPRLLSKGGKPVADAPERAVSEGTSASTDTTNTTSSTTSGSVNPVEAKKSKMVAHDPNSMKISKFLWDDSGDSNGVATIRIDKLPQNAASSTEDLLDVKNLTIEDVQAELTEDKTGLGVQIQASGDKKYRLNIPVLYEAAESVKAVVKPKRILIKLKKIPKEFTPKDADASSTPEEAPQYETWPQPHKKV